jgi:hypothetical protein
MKKEVQLCERCYSKQNKEVVGKHNCFYCNASLCEDCYQKITIEIRKSDYQDSNQSRIHTLNLCPICDKCIEKFGNLDYQIIVNTIADNFKPHLALESLKEDKEKK